MNYGIKKAYDQFINAICLWLCDRFPERTRIIPHAEDPTQDLLVQFMVWPKHLYLQHFLSPESYQWFHRHRWGKMRSFVLSGYFLEHRQPEDRYITHRRLSTYAMDRTVIHRVAFWSRTCWTLFWVRDSHDDWGYFSRKTFDSTVVEYVPWRQHVQKRVANLETGAVTK